MWWIKSSEVEKAGQWFSLPLHLQQQKKTLASLCLCRKGHLVDVLLHVRQPAQEELGALSSLPAYFLT